MARVRVVRLPQFSLERLQLVPELRAAVVGNLNQIVFDRRPVPGVPVSLEAATRRVDAASEVDFQLLEVAAGFLVHRCQVLD